MTLIPRVGIIVYLTNLKHERHIRKYGYIVYRNKRQKYVKMYMNEDKAEMNINKMMKLKYIIDIDVSPYKTLKKTYTKEKHEVL